VKYSDFAKSFHERVVEGRKVKGSHNSQKIHFGSKDSFEAKTARVSLSKESFLAEIARKRNFINQIKVLELASNFQVGSNEPSFERKEVAATTDPEYEKVVVSPRPHKNISTLKIKY
jgi:hypothetical protein